ncbi:hypothetical protein M3P21_17130 [Ruegeria sp. 2012CJ41-6]|uniref:Sulfotransferase family protein n=1 Tax=Ruegeria spongiae TaxID=2942209 RepID=A0ABT0Q5W4_9RHOB|nr:hypothetical protein [Ruegeria spongiae]MCL6285254.1 hypothetical protein [Ruegeria spongiae]
MTRLIIHPGSPKTATSTIQHILSSNREALSRAGIGLILPQDFRGSQYFGEYMKMYRAGSVSGFEQATADFFGPYFKKYKTVVCSSETFCHDFMPSRKYGFGGIDRSEISAEVLTYTGAASTKIILTVRPQRDFLISTYTHFVHRQKEFRTYQDWLEAEVDLPRVLWSPVVKSFRDRFNEVEVVPMRGDYLNTVLSTLTPRKLKLSIDTDVQNPSLSGRAIQLARIMNKEIQRQDKAERVNNAILHNFPVSEFGKFKPAMELPAEITQLHDEDLAAAISTDAVRPVGHSA